MATALCPNSSQRRLMPSQRGRACFVFTCANPHSLVIARRDVEFRRALKTSSAVVADGAGCQWVAALFRLSIGPRITGFDYFVALMSALNRTGGKVFFFGSQSNVLEIIRDRVRSEFPQLSVAMLSPPFRSWSAAENQSMIMQIKQFQPDVLWVGMTAPKQEKWVNANVPHLQIPVIGSIGAVFDYYAGVTRRAPQWICRLGFEWLYRLPREPHRLWRRTFVSAPKFLWFVLLERAATLWKR